MFLSILFKDMYIDSCNLSIKRAQLSGSSSFHGIMEEQSSITIMAVRPTLFSIPIFFCLVILFSFYQTVHFQIFKNIVHDVAMPDCDFNF